MIPWGMSCGISSGGNVVRDFKWDFMWEGIQVGFQVECREGFQVGFRVVVDPAGGRPRGCGWLLVVAGMWQWTPRMWMVAGMWL